MLLVLANFDVCFELQKYRSRIPKQAKMSVAVRLWASQKQGFDSFAEESKLVARFWLVAEEFYVCLAMMLDAQAQTWIGNFKHSFKLRSGSKFNICFYPIKLHLPFLNLMNSSVRWISTYAASKAKTYATGKGLVGYICFGKPFQFRPDPTALKQV